MKNEHNKNLDRRDFLKVLGGAAAVTSATLLPGCKNKQESAYRYKAYYDELKKTGERENGRE